MSLHEDVRMLTELVLSLDEDKATENLEADLIALAMLKEARSNLAIIERDLENVLAKAMGDKHLVVDGVGTFERAKKKNRTKWDRDGLLRDVSDSRLFNPNTGELIEETPVEKILAVWNLGAPRLTVLRDRGLDPDQYCESEDAGYSVRLIA